MLIVPYAPRANKSLCTHWKIDSAANMFNKLAFLTFAFMLAHISACTHTRALLDAPSYTEKLSSLYMSEDGDSFVIFTDSYHYIFKMPATLSASLSSDYAKILAAKFNEFHVAKDYSINGEVELMVPVSTATKQQLDSALKKGFTQTHKYWLTNKINLYGMRYQSNGINPEAPERPLNGNYSIKITEDRTVGGTLLIIPQTPVTLLEDAVQIGAAALVLIVMAISG